MAFLQQSLMVSEHLKSTKTKKGGAGAGKVQKKWYSCGS